MVRCLVAGAAGLIGRHAVRELLDAGHEVHAITRSSASDASTGMTWHQGDLLAEGFAEEVLDQLRPTHLLHLAWVTEHGRFWAAPENRSWGQATKRLVEAFSNIGGQRVVAAGSCAEYDWSNLGDGICHERTTPINPHTPYGVAKAETSSWLEGFAASAGLSQAWGRVFFLYGAGENPSRLIPSVASALLAGREAKCSSGRQVRDFMDARDVGAAFARLLLSNMTGPVNIASGEGQAIADVVAMIAEICGGADLVRLGALPDRKDDPPVLVADVTRMRDELGFVPRVALREGLEAFCAVLKEGGA